MKIIRRGKQWTVHWMAFRWYRKQRIRSFDVVVDQVNTVPFFTPMWAPIPSVMLIHQLAREVWWYESPFPISGIGYLLEPLYLRFYRRSPVITVSESTRSDLVRLGFRGPILVVPEGVTFRFCSSVNRAAEPTFAYVGRLAPSKRIGHILQAFAEFSRATGRGSLLLAGQGEPKYRKSLLRQARRLNIEPRVQFLGWISDERKQAVMASSYAVLMASIREGWGLAVSEANACGTPAIVYDVPGLRDSVRHNLTGLVVKPEPRFLARAMIQLFQDPLLHSRLARGAEQVSQYLSFDESARQVREALDRTRAA